MSSQPQRTLPTSIFFAAIGCGHTITDESVELLKSGKSDTTAQLQLLERLQEASYEHLGPSSKASTVAYVTYLAILNCPARRVEAGLLQLGASKNSERNALGQLGDRMEAAYSGVVEAETLRATFAEPAAASSVALRASLSDLIDQLAGLVHDGDAEPEVLLKARIALSTYDFAHEPLLTNTCVELPIERPTAS